MKKLFLLIITGSTLLFTSCNDDDANLTSNNFTITIENTFDGKTNFATGSTGLIMPGQSESFSFYAGQGHYLQFATMYVQSNDVFIGPDDTGIALYNTNGDALTGNITSTLSLWDAGTEVNEQPGVGPNQAPRQSGANTGATENGNVVLLEDVNDGYTYPTTNELIEVTLTHDGGTLFTATINNISSTSAIPSPFAPGVWLIHNAGVKPLFTTGSPSTMGLEGLAEDGNITELSTALSDASGLVSPFAPGAYAVGSGTELFISGQSPSAAIEALAEDGDPSGFSNIFNTPVGGSSPAPIFPGESYSFSFDATQGDMLSFATMLVQSNDWFIGANDIALFSNGIANVGDLTGRLRLYDGGSEVDEFAGAGNNQAPRQAGPNTGQDENGAVGTESSPGAHVPAVNEMIRVTLTAN